MPDSTVASGNLVLDSRPSTAPPADATTELAVRRTDQLGLPPIAEVSLFSAGTSSPQGVIALRTLNPGASTGLVERMRIDTNGFVGIGSPAPAPTQALEVAGTVKATAFQGNGSALTGVSDPSKVSTTGDTMTGALNLPANGLIVGTQQLVLASGNVGIGTATPAARLQVAGDAIMKGDIIVRDAADKERIRLDNGSAGILVKDADG